MAVLRGVDAAGVPDLRRALRLRARWRVTPFTTTCPGCYQARATHIHLRIRQALPGSTSYDFTSQLFFAETFLTSLYTSQPPYTTKGDAGRLRNANDGIYSQGGSNLLITPEASGSGYKGTLNIGPYV